VDSHRPSPHDDGVSVRSVGECAFGAAEVGDAKPEKQGHHAQTEQESGKVKGTISAQHAPAEAVYHADDRIKTIQNPPFLRNDGTREATGET